MVYKQNFKTNWISIFHDLIIIQFGKYGWTLHSNRYCYCFLSYWQLQAVLNVNRALKLRKTDLKPQYWTRIIHCYRICSGHGRFIVCVHTRFPKMSTWLNRFFPFRHKCWFIWKGRIAQTFDSSGDIFRWNNALNLIAQLKLTAVNTIFVDMQSNFVSHGHEISLQYRFVSIMDNSFCWFYWSHDMRSVHLF